MFTRTNGPIASQSMTVLYTADETQRGSPPVTEGTRGGRCPRKALAERDQPLRQEFRSRYGVPLSVAWP